MEAKPFYIEIENLNQDEIDSIYMSCVKAGVEIFESPSGRSDHQYYGICKTGNDLTFYHNKDFFGNAKEITIDQLDEWLGLNQDETPEEKEAFEAMGGPCETPDSDDCIYTELRHIGDRIHNIACGVDDNLQDLLSDISSKLWSIETPQQREERERLEASREMFIDAGYSEIFWRDNPDDAHSIKIEEVILSIYELYDRGYRKAK